MCEIGRRIYNKGFAAANDGNISYRLGEDRVLCSPTRVSKGYMKPDDLCIVDLDGKQVSGMTKEMIQKLPATDARLTDALQQIVKERGWPTIALVGIDASNAAMLILTHTADHAWQRQLLPQLQVLADAGKIDGSSLALVVDKELVAAGKLQRYGSQFKFINGKMAMYAVEDPSTLNQRRAQALLPPMDVYKELLAQIYHLQASDDVVMATAPAKK